MASMFMPASAKRRVIAATEPGRWGSIVVMTRRSSNIIP